MNCKFCNAEIRETDDFCPSCGKSTKDSDAVTQTEGTAQEAAPVEEIPEVGIPVPQEEDIPKKPKKKAWKVITAIVCCVVLVAGLTVAVLYGMGIDLRPRENNVQYKDNYTVEDVADLDKAADKVVATVGDYTLTNGQLQVFYWMQYYSFLDYYGDYLSYLGLNYTQPLHAQVVPDTETTWEQYFLDLALATWHRYQTLVIISEQEGYQMPEDIQQYLTQIPENLRASAEENGFESVEAMLQVDMGPGCTLEDYMAYMNLYYRGVSYFDSIYTALEIGDEDVRAYFLENAADYESQYGVTMDSGKLIDVRHILVCPQGGTEDEEGVVTYSDEEWEACRVKAQGILDTWNAGDKTEESFAELANTSSEDPGSNTAGGLYSYVAQGDMVEAFDAWCFDESRQPGDTGLVQTPYGYHVMYFVYGEEGWLRYGSEGLRSQESSKVLDDATDTNPMEVNYKKIVLGQAIKDTADTAGTTGATDTTAPTQ